MKVEARYPQIALKMFREHLKNYFHKEADNLRKIQAIDHPHLIKPIAAFERGESRCFVFPWADGGNLRDLWKKSDPPASDISLVAWALKQMLGLADCLMTLYDQNCRHGDLKPENILRFTDGSGRGTLVIADFGLAKFHLYETMRRNSNSSIMDRTLRYEPPEMDEYINQPRSRGDDVWSVGCIFLEFTIWLLYGWEYLEQFNSTNREQKFWEDRDGERRVHCRVQNEISKILGDLKVDAALRDLVILIRDRLLVVKQAAGENPSENDRAMAHELRGNLEHIYKRSLEKDSYLLSPKIFRGPGMGNTLTVREKPQVPRISKESLAPNADVGPRILVRAATGDLVQDEDRLKPVINPDETVSIHFPSSSYSIALAKIDAVRKSSFSGQLMILGCC